jgi:UDP-N-acetylglucosamine--N-acetylmuramyl-(pentapeptide) pyrophosphoryl-undecaprenol N-acetylglucosamine transferase
VRVIVTGGGTGGHVFPALEVARLAKADGADVLYMGSLRGQERRSCEKVGIPFVGFPSEPIYSIKSPRGWLAALNLLRATVMARRELKRARAHVLFSTGGYSSAPVVTAARGLGLPFVLHEQNSVPGRTNLMAAKRASYVATTFHSADSRFPGSRVVRTGLPVREELREIAASHRLLIDASPLCILVVGGSQGAAALNESALATATRMTERDLRWIHVTGKAHFETIFPTYEKLGIGAIYEVKSFMEGPAMAEAYAQSAIVVGRSGAGTLSELAAFRIPSVLVPYPAAYANHQFHNAEEFAEMGAAVVVPQDVLHPSKLQEALSGWIDDPSSRERAQQALSEWDQPNAARAILELVSKAANKE